MSFSTRKHQQPDVCRLALGIQRPSMQAGAVSAMAGDYQTKGSCRALGGTSQRVKVSSRGEQLVLMHPWFKAAHNKRLPLPVATSEAAAEEGMCASEEDASPEHFVPLAKKKKKSKQKLWICLSAVTLYNSNQTKTWLSVLSCLYFQAFLRINCSQWK